MFSDASSTSVIIEVTPQPPPGTKIISPLATWHNQDEEAKRRSSSLSFEISIARV